MSLSNTSLQKKFRKKAITKVITGLSNFNLNDIVIKIKAAELAKATYVDIAAHPDIVISAKSISTLPICVSSISPTDLYNCVLAGAEIIEIGNFDIFYNYGISFSELQILKLAEETRALFKNIIICVTIPHILPLERQIKLAIQLENLGIDLIQTEGKSSKNQDLCLTRSHIINSSYKSSCPLSSAYALSRVIQTPIIASSGLDNLSAPIAIACGASGVGIGSALNQFTNISLMANYLQEIVSSIDYNRGSISCVIQKSISLNSKILT